VFRRLKLLTYLHEINLSPEETLALMRRLATDSCRAEDYEVLIKMVRAHTHLSADFLEAPPVPERSSPARRTTRKRQGAQSARRRHRR
jgi:anti-sigma factor RsiW